MSSKEFENRKIILHNYQKNPSASYKSIATASGVSKSTAFHVIKQYKTSLSINRAKGSGRKKGFMDQKVANKIRRSFEQNPGLSNRERAKKFKVSEFFVRKVKKVCNFKSYRAIKYPNRSDKQSLTAKTRARKLYEEVLTKLNGCLIMDDETYIKCDFNQLPGPKYYTAIVRGGVSSKYKYKSMDKFGKKLLLWQAICSCGLKSRAFVTSSTLNSDVYIKECLQARLLPFYRKHNVPCWFWPDLASCHYSKKTMDWYTLRRVNFIPKTLNPPNCPQFRPIEKFWAIGKGYLRKSGKTINSAKELVKEWSAVGKKITQTTVQKLMSSIVANVRLFIRNKEKY